MKSNQENNFEIKKYLLNFMMKLIKKPVQIKTFHGGNISDTIRSVDYDLNNIHISKMLTPIGIQPEALIMANDGVFIKYSIDKINKKKKKKITFSSTYINNLELEQPEMKISIFFIYILIKALFKVDAYKVLYDDVDLADEEDRSQNKYSMFKRDLGSLLYPAEILKNSRLIDGQYADDRSPFQTAYDEYSLGKILDSASYEDPKEPREEETESHSSLIAGHQYVSGGAGEGKQYLRPDGEIDNRDEVKSDEDLPAYCDPPNPCPIGYLGEDCDPRPFAEFTAEFSKNYQEQQNCMCDEDHNECSKTVKPKSADKINKLLENIRNLEISDNKGFSPVVAKKSPRLKRSKKARSISNDTNLKNTRLLDKELKVENFRKLSVSVSQ
ncbi:neuroendocrine 7B2 [Brachionus plicatilis]|uniref:Neuroendocrine protein 7B2 n=1 Tax=Brachionus plicatilis TaxID=10195 RepID=A0A3M7RYX8_BRAPC|nr:neuroendocrine 7B2 [Brachionus plicatilis]